MFSSFGQPRGSDLNVNNTRAIATKRNRPWRFSSRIQGLVGVVLAVALWGLAVHLLQVNLPLAGLLGPKETWVSFYELLTTNQLTAHILVSLKRVLVGLALAVLFGVPIGLAIGRSRLLDNVTGGTFQFLRMVSPLSWMPIAVMMFGIGDAPIYFL